MSGKSSRVFDSVWPSTGKDHRDEANSKLWPNKKSYKRLPKQFEVYSTGHRTFENWNDMA